MPIVRYALAGAAAASLLGGAAYAHHYRHHHHAVRPIAENAQPMPAPTGGAVETSAVVNGQTVQVISSQPVPDTPENRAKYGQPLSHAGKMTPAIGN